MSLFLPFTVNYGWIDKFYLTIKWLVGDASWRQTQIVAIYKYKMDYGTILKYISTDAATQTCRSYHCRQPSFR